MSNTTVNRSGEFRAEKRAMREFVGNSETVKVNSEVYRQLIEEKGRQRTKYKGRIRAVYKKKGRRVEWSSTTSKPYPEIFRTKLPNQFWRTRSPGRRDKNCRFGWE